MPKYSMTTRQDGGRGLQGRWRRQTDLLRLSRSTEGSGINPSHRQLDLFEGLGKNSQAVVISLTKHVGVGKIAAPGHKFPEQFAV
jgi:hypothetical protein